jgi:hypothetical protein
VKRAGAPQRGELVCTLLILFGYWKYSEENSELFQIADGWLRGGPAVSMACGEIPCAAEQGSRFALSGK